MISGELVFDEETLSKLKYVKCCFLEAVRIRSPGVITRKVVKSFSVKVTTNGINDKLEMPFQLLGCPRILFDLIDSIINI